VLLLFEWLSKAEVTDFELLILANEDVIEFEIKMSSACVFMDSPDALTYLVEEIFDRGILVHCFMIFTYNVEKISLWTKF